MPMIRWRTRPLVAVAVFWLLLGVCQGQQGLRGRLNDSSTVDADLSSTMGILQAASEAWLRDEEAAFKQAIEELSTFRASDVIGTGALLDGTFIRTVNDRSPSRDDLLPMCGWVEPIVQLQLYCPTLRYVQAQLRPSIVQRTLLRDTGMYQHEHEPANDGTLPQPLADIGTPLPYLVDRDVVEAERKTVYWYYRLILNLYGYCVRWLRARGADTVAPALVPSGYHDSRLFMLDEGWSSWRSRFPVPIAQSILKGEHLVILLRGTLLPGGWLSDATYAYAPESLTKAYGFEGRVHQGFLNFTLEVLADVEAEVNRHPHVTRVTLAGHSLGGAVGTLLADYLARKRGPSLTVELLAIAAPNVGNKVFVKGFNTRVRARHIMYLGDGSKTDSGPYGFGDLIPQIPPPCWPSPSCSGVLFADPDTLEGDGWAGGFEYQLIGGNVAIYATDLPNSEAWREKERLVTRDSSLASCHVCSYLCWSVQGLDDPEDRCYFTTQGDQHPWPCPYSTLGERIDNVWSKGVMALQDEDEGPDQQQDQQQQQPSASRPGPNLNDGNI